MGLKRTVYEDRESWLKGRGVGFGGSDAAVIIGCSRWKTNMELWKEKTGRAIPPDISDKPAVQRGILMEPVLRAYYQAMHPDERVEYHAFDMLYQEERPWLFATLDGEIYRPDGTVGIFEAKSAEPIGRAGWDEWYNRIPNHYYAQILHQFLATGFDFAVLVAGLVKKDGSTIIREYLFRREDCLEDMKMVVEHEEEFWAYVREDKMPPMCLTM